MAQVSCIPAFYPSQMLTNHFSPHLIPLHLHTKTITFPSHHKFSKSKAMAATTAAFSPARTTAAVVSIGSNRPQKRDSKVVYIRGLNSFGGLKAHNSVASLGMPLCTEQCFANAVNAIKASGSSGKGKSGGALGAKCSKIGEIFTIAATINGLVLLGVAVGFVLLRIEAWYEETAD